MKEIRLTALPGTSTFYHFVSIGESSLDSQEFCTKLLLEHKIATVPGIGYGKSCDRFIRVSVGAEPQERNKLGLDAIKKLIVETTEKKNGK
jgi:aspartate aminotransferase/aminotransferase